MLGTGYAGLLHSKRRKGLAMTPLKLAFLLAPFLYFSLAAAHAQDSQQSLASSQPPPITVRSNLVLVPTLVKTTGGEVVFTLRADDFALTDNGVPQPLQAELDADSQPIALVVIVQTGGLGVLHLNDYRHLGPLLDAVIGGVPHRVAVIGFGGTPRLEQDFTSDTETATRTIATLHQHDSGASILDAIKFGINLLAKQAPDYRRVVLLFSETIDGGSQTSLEDAVRAINETNTRIYSFGFSSTKAAVKHEASKVPRPGGTPYTNEPFASGGCLSHDQNVDPDASGKRSVQALDCASDLLPPLRLARMAFLSAREGLRRNVPESVAQTTGGEYFAFTNAKMLSRHLIDVSNDVPNYYILSFRPQSPQPGFHALKLRLRDKPGLRLSSRGAYWVDEGTTANSN